MAQTGRFIAVGECMGELSEAGDGTFRLGFAGDTFNTAWYARRRLPAGWQVGYATAVGDDALSARMRAFMADSGIDTSAVRSVPGRTIGLYLIALAGGERSFTYWRGESAARLLADDPAALGAGLAGADVIFVSGVTLAILRAEARGVLLGALAAARADGATVAFDTNLRPRLWDDAETMRGAVGAAAGVADIVLPSFDEEQAAFGDADPAATAARYAGAGARLVAVKNGAGPVTLCCQEEGTTEIPPAHVVTPVDTTAAGDSFDAAFLAAHLIGAGAPDAARAGMELAARVIQSRGALVAV